MNNQTTHQRPTRRLIAAVAHDELLLKAYSSGIDVGDKIWNLAQEHRVPMLTVHDAIIAVLNNDYDLIDESMTLPSPLQELYDETPKYTEGPDAYPMPLDWCDARVRFLDEVEELLAPLFGLPAGWLGQLPDNDLAEAIADYIEDHLWELMPSQGDHRPDFNADFARALEILREHLLKGA